MFGYDFGMRNDTAALLAECSIVCSRAYARVVATINETADDPGFKSRHVLHQAEADLAAALDKLRTLVRS
jgi:hypothetical protein